MAAAAGLVALWLRRPAYVYLSGALLNVAGTILWWWWAAANVDILNWNFRTVAGLVQSNVLALAAGSIVWSLLRVTHRDGVPHARWGGRQQPAAHVAAGLGACLLGVLVAVCVVYELLGLRHVGPQRLDWIALAAVALAAAVCLWDHAREFALSTLYGLGLAALGMELLALELPSQRMFCWSAAVELAAFALAAALVARLLHALRTPRQAPASGPCSDPPWFAAVQAIVVALAAALATWIALDYGFDGAGRQVAIGATLKLIGRPASIFALLMLLGTAVPWTAARRPIRRPRWQYAAIGLATLLGCAAGWALLPAAAPAPWLHRSVIAMTAAAVAICVASFGLRAVLLPESGWIDRAKRSVPPLAALAALSLAAVLIQEVALFQSPAGTPMSSWAVALVGVTLAGLAAAGIATAVWPQLDPLALDDRGRQAYVYAAEVCLALLAVHVRLTLPWLFHQYFRPYWMLILMAVAFVGAGLGEWFHRRKLAVLAEPLWRTALVMPLAPAAGFWFMQQLTASDMPWVLTNQTPLVWFIMGVFYSILAATRRSLGCSVLAAVTFNLALWVSWHQYEIAFFSHPQLWLIPPALAGLVAEHLNRDRLTDAQRSGFRYLMLSVIYLASTADMFIAGVAHIGENWWLPLILMVLSVAGELLGILLRIRSFLALGMAFLLVNVVSIIWYAAVNLHHTWIWYVCGIGLGAAIIAMFAVFEKRRNDVLAAVERLKEWKG